MVVISAVLINLRALGVIETERPVRAMVQAWYPVILIAVAVLAASGFLLIASEPGRALFRWVFWVKLGLIVVALAATGAQGRFDRPCRDHGRYPEPGQARIRRSRRCAPGPI